MRFYDVEYRTTGAHDQVFVAGTFSDPAWDPQPMSCVFDDGRRRIYSKQVKVEPGCGYEFKFKVGSENSWVVDESRPVVSDHAGNQNNFLRIPPDDTRGQDTPPFSKAFLERKRNVNEPQTPARVGRLKAATVEEGSRHSTTPIPIVARTAAEVADTARGLDRVDLDELDAPNTDDNNIQQDLHTPLFAHEGFGGAYEFVDDRLDHTDTSEPEIRWDSLRSGSKDFAMEEDVDLNDPTIQKFPSDRMSVMDTLRKIQSSSSVDHSHFESFLVSPRFEPRRLSVDSADDGTLSSGSLSPTSMRKRDCRLSHSSFHRSKSAISLGSIAEAADDDDDNSDAVLSSPPPPAPAVAKKPGIRGGKTSSAKHGSSSTDFDEPLLMVSDEGF